MPLIPGDQFWVNIQAAWKKGNLGTNLLNSFIMAAGITFGKIVVSMLGAFSIVYFDYRFRIVAFVTVFCTLMLPVEVRILPTYEMAANLFGPLQPVWDLLHLDGLASWFAGHEIEEALEWGYPIRQLPRINIAPGGNPRQPAPFFSVSFFLTIPEELCEAALKWTGPRPWFFSGKYCSPFPKPILQPWL